jgi:hypothetical protein
MTRVLLAVLAVELGLIVWKLCVIVQLMKAGTDK